MWKYTHTDEMYHSLTGNNSSTELFHSDVYLGQDFSDGIRHWKYIKREMVNGRWKYYYKDDAYDKANSKFKSATNKYLDNANKADKELKNHSEAHKKNVNNNSTIDRYNRSGLIGKIRYKKEANAAVKSNKELVKKADQYVEDYHTASKNADDALKEAKAAEKERNKAKNKDKARKALAKGGIKVANAASEAGYKTKKSIAKGKKAVKKALKKAFPETHTSTIYGPKTNTVTKYVNGKMVEKKEVPRNSTSTKKKKKK